MQMTRIFEKPAMFVAAALLAGTAFMSNSVSTQAQQGWPTRAVTMVVPYGPGASNDTFTRALSQIFSKKFNQPFVVENRPGAGGFTGAAQVAKSNPDGYIWLESPNSIATFQEVLKLGIDPTTDLVPVSVFARSPIGMLVPSALPVNNVKEFVEYAKKNPDTFYGYAGLGTAQHLHAELFNDRAGIKLKGVGYKSSADAQVDLVAGRLQVMFVTVASTIGQINSGQLKLLGYTNDSSPPGAPKAPTLKEAGVAGMEQAQSWWAIFAPKGTPAPIVNAMNAAIQEALKEPSFIELLTKTGASPVFKNAADSAKEVKEEGALMGKIVKDANIKIEN
jgi:tripartite-type tricarboxylate transporter receptor subunit TctC